MRTGVHINFLVILLKEHDNRVAYPLRQAQGERTNPSPWEKPARAEPFDFAQDRLVEA